VRNFKRDMLNEISFGRRLSIVTVKKTARHGDPMTGCYRRGARVRSWPYPEVFEIGADFWL
jgi:hypothetical protein